MPATLRDLPPVIGVDALGACGLTVNVSTVVAGRTIILARAELSSAGGSVAHRGSSAWGCCARCGWRRGREPREPARRLGGRVVTPRTGTPVEINALWYNALRAMSSLARVAGRHDATWDQMAGRAAAVFEGDAPFASRGAIAQAWSVAETLRAWCEIGAAGSGRPA